MQIIIYIQSKNNWQVFTSCAFMFCFQVNETIPTRNSLTVCHSLRKMPSPTVFSSTLSVLLLTFMLLTSIKRCFFDLTQPFNRKINEVGLKRLLESNHDLNLALRLIPMISFVPIDMVTVAFAQSIEDFERIADRFELDEDISEKLDQVVFEFQKNLCQKGRQKVATTESPCFQ